MLDTMMLLGDIMKEIRLKRGGSDMTQEKFAETIGVSDAFVSQVENNKRPMSKKVVAKIVEVYGFDDEDRKELDKKLRVAASMAKDPELTDVMVTALQEEVKDPTGVKGEKPTVEFVKALTEDIAAVDMPHDVLSQALGVKTGYIRGLQSRKVRVTREQLILLAEALSVNPDRYLVLNGHLPVGLMANTEACKSFRNALLQIDGSDEAALTMLANILSSVRGTAPLEKTG